MVASGIESAHWLLEIAFLINPTKKIGMGGCLSISLCNTECLRCFFPAALRDPMTMERTNLLNMAKLSIKGLIESALSFGRTLDSDYPPLQQFFVVMEHCLKHGLKGENERQGSRCKTSINGSHYFHFRNGLFLFFLCVCSVKKSFLGFNKSLWGPLELVEKLCPEAAEISASVRDLPGLK